MDSFNHVMFLQKAFKSQLQVSRKLIKDKKLNNKLKQLQLCIANAVASFERLSDEESGEIQKQIKQFTENKNQMRLNIVRRVEILCKEYNQVKTAKHELLNRALAVTIDEQQELVKQSSQLSLLFKERLELLDKRQIEFLIQSQMYDQIRQQLQTEMDSENSFIHDYVSLIYM